MWNIVFRNCGQRSQQIDSMK